MHTIQLHLVNFFVIRLVIGQATPALHTRNAHANLQDKESESESETEWEWYFATDSESESEHTDKYRRYGKYPVYTGIFGVLRPFYGLPAPRRATRPW